MAEREASEIFGYENQGNFLLRLWKKRKGLVLFSALLFLVILGFFLYQVFLVPKPAPEPAGEPEVSQTESQPASFASASTSSDRVVLFGDTNFQSESYKIGDIAIGGEAEFLLTEDSPEPMAISGIRGEAFAEKNSADMKLILTWKTNKLSKAQVRYSKGVGQTAKMVDEEDYSFSHSIVVGGLDPASTYVYTITAYDRFGGSTSSDPHAVYTGSKAVSLFNLIADAIGEVFGWAVKK